MYFPQILKPLRIYVELMLLPGFLLISLCDLSAQEHNLQVKNYSVDDGLSQSTVYAINQDATGFIWMGTRDGLNRFDGYSFNTYRPSALGDNQYDNVSVRTILAAKEDPGLWLGTDGTGVYQFNPLREEFIHFSDLFTFNGSEVPQNIHVLSMIYDSDDNILIGTRYKGIWKLDLSEKRMYRIKSDIIKDSAIWTLFTDSSKRLWVGSENGLFIFEEDARVKQFLDGKRVVSILNGQGSVYWIASYNNSLYTLDLDAADHGIIDFNTLTENYKLIDPHEYRQESLSDHSIRSFFQDRTGVIWIGTNTAGVDNWSKFRNKFHSIQYAGENGWGLNNRVVLSINEVSNGNLWVGTPAGISIMDKDSQSAEYFTHDPDNRSSISDHAVITIEEDQDETVWVGTDGGGLHRWSGNGNSFYHYQNEQGNPESITDNSVLTLEASQDGNLWVGTFNGLNLFDPKQEKFQQFGHAGLKDGRILSLLEAGNYLWIGTYSGGLARMYLSTRKIQPLTEIIEVPENIPQNRIQTLYLDAQNNLWAGCYNGLMRIDTANEKIKLYTTQHGLPNNVVYGILPDDTGHLWLSTNKGISRFNLKTQTFYNFGTDDGIPGSEYNGGAYHRNSDGELFFGGVNGLTYFHPEKIEFNDTRPNVEITGFRLAGVAQPAPAWNAEERIKLKHNENFFSFSFSVLDYVAPDVHEYQYKLDGLNSDWIDAGNKREALYTSVPPGEYTFRVKGSNADGVWSENSAPVKILITPPFWQTWWFILAAFVFFAAIGYTLYRYRINSVLEAHRTREHIAGDLHDDLGATLSSISLFSQAAEKELKSGKKSLRYLQLITQSANRAKENLSDIIWSINPEKDDWELYAAKCRRYASDLFDANDIDYNLSLTTDINLPHDLNLRKNLWLIFKELTINITKHSDAGFVNISCYQQNKAVVLIVKDDGDGISPEDFKKGNGLKNIRRRAEEINAELELDTEPGSGTRWELKINR